MSTIVDVARGNFQDAIHRAEKTSPTIIPARIRRSRFLLELAVAHAHQREPFAAIHYLGSAVSESREAIVPIPWVADLAKELVAMAPPTLHQKALDLAARCGSPIPA